MVLLQTKSLNQRAPFLLKVLTALPHGHWMLISQRIDYTEHCWATSDAQIPARHYSSDASASGLPLGLNRSQEHVLCVRVCVCVNQSTTAWWRNYSMQSSTDIPLNKTVRKLFLPNTKWSPSARTDDFFPVSVRSPHWCTSQRPVANEK